MATLTNQVIKTLSQALTAMAAFAGGTVPTSTSTEYADWVRWIQVKQEEYAVRGFWRRLLKKTSFSFSGETTVLPDDFYKPNGMYVFEVDGVDWADPNNEDGMQLFVEMVTDKDSANFGKWQVRFPSSQDAQTASMWYFGAPPVPTASSDILILPGDMIVYGALIEYFRKANQDGSMDKAEQDAENRFNTYISLEMIPPKYELLSFATQTGTKIDRLARARNYYLSRTNRNLSE